MRHEDHPDKEHRQYIRLDTVFPVQFRIESFDGKRFLSNWIQGFTSNVSKGGICLNVNNLDSDLAKVLKEFKACISLEIDLPVYRKPVVARANVSWIKESANLSNKYLIGLSYFEINPLLNNRIMRYARGRKLFLPIGLSLIVLLGLGLLVNGLINIRLVHGNKILVQQLVNNLQDFSIAKRNIAEINKERQDLQQKIYILESRIRTVEFEKANIDDNGKTEISVRAQKVQELSSLINQLSTEKESLRQQMDDIRSKEAQTVQALSKLDKVKTTLEKANFDNMYKWLQVHQNPRTGLVISFEGDKDLGDWAFIYDQSLVAQAYTNFLDFERAQKIFNFFKNKAKRKDGLFLNAYYANGGEPAEYIVHSGPNIWLGIAILQYTYKTQDNSYMDLAQDIASGIMNLQNQDPQGGIRGGPDVQWYATEHNLDAYAFFDMLYKITGKIKFAQARDKIWNWLLKHTYDKVDVPIKRGKGDSTIATDTYAWSIAAIGPKKLKDSGLNPEEIMQFAENNCAVTVSYIRPGGQTIRIKGFDFAPQIHVGRGGVVSSEWTAQMVISFKIMSDYYAKQGMADKAKLYKTKADEYLISLENMIISSPSPSGQGESCLPYATQDFVDTGHGWFTPKGKATGSVAGTTYTNFAFYNYNPLELKN